MHAARIFVKVLALLAGFGGLCGTVASLFMLAAIATGYFPPPKMSVDVNILGLMAALFATFGIVGYLILRQAWWHFRQPSRDTARAIIAIATFMGVARVLTIVEKQELTGGFEKALGPLGSLAVKFAIVAAAVALYRLLFRRIADMAYAPENPGLRQPAGPPKT